MSLAALPAARAALSGRHIVVTRPQEQAGTMAQLIAAQGGVPVLFPVLAIADVADVQPIVDVAQRLDDYALAIFISPNAVAKALNIVLSRRAWPPGVGVACVGKSSERALARLGFAQITAPQGRFDSEALLELAPLQADAVAGKRVVIFRGDGGRELLGDTLIARGARLDYVECYRRGRPNLDVAPLLKLWARGELDAVTVTSSEGLRNLFDMVGRLGQQWLRRTPLFVPHARIAEAAASLGLDRVTLTGPGDDGLMEGLAAYFSTQFSTPPTAPET